MRLPLPEGAHAQVTDGESLVYGVRPEYLDYSPTPVPGALTGQVVVVENLGSFSLVSLDVPDETAADDGAPAGTGHAGSSAAAAGGAAEAAGTSVQVVVAEGSEPEPGDTGWVVPRPGRSLLYRDGNLVAVAAAPAPRAGAAVGG